MKNNNKTALITGASRGLGLALATSLAQQNWNLIITGRNPETLQLAQETLSKNTRVAAIAGDVVDLEHQKELRTAVEQFGSLHLLVNNASILGPSPQPHLLDYPLDVLEKVYQTNVIAPLGVLQAARKWLVSNACIINITSDAAVAPYAGWGGYGSAKAALEHLGAILAAENPQWRVYWVDPGDMRTDLHQQAFPEEDISHLPLPEKSVPCLLTLIESNNANGRYQAHAIENNLQMV